MSETKHTPGPWHQPVQWDGWQGAYVPRGRIETGAGPGEGAIVVAIDGFPPEETLANARLIAAAPDLLAACNALVDALAFAIRANVPPDMAQQVVDNHVLIKMALNTIAKAEGVRR